MATSIRDEEDDNGLFTNKSTMMANFEEWIKMATDNKINSRNSWNFALIDYFHDLNVLKDAEDNINFQKASATLDGCVKIYSSRVDSVANETGKLLSGLAERRIQVQHVGDGANAESPDGEEDGVTIDPTTGLPISNDVDSTTRRRNYNRVLETTLVDFESLRMKELDQELSIDPLFKKALADFDEGGAKSLLLNTLHVDNTARVVFDAATNNKKGHAEPIVQERLEEDDVSADVSKSREENIPSTPALPETSLSSNCDSKEPVDLEDEILALGMDLMDFNLISQCQICPSMQQLKAVVEDINKAKSFIEDVNSKFDNFLTEQDLQDAIPPNGDNDEQDFNASYEDEDMNNDLFDDEADGIDNPGIENASHNFSTADEDKSTVDIITNVMDKDLMAYFDESLKKSWRGREHWKVRSFKKRILAEKMDNAQDKNEKSKALDKETTTSTKTQTKNVSIDFFKISDDMEETVFNTKKKANIEMPQKLRENSSHYLLPNDYQFSTQKVTRLFIKPEQHMSFFSHRKSRNTTGSQGTFKLDDIESRNNEQTSEIADENFWARNYELREEDQAAAVDGETEIIQGNEMENPFDDNDGGIDFNQAFASDGIEEFGENSEDSAAPGSAGVAHGLNKADAKVPYSRVSKKVDVRRLKDNIWKSIVEILHDNNTNDNSNNTETAPPDDVDNSTQTQDEQETPTVLKFTEIATKISTMYSGESKNDLSTSFCFICLLHLANEHGFEISHNNNFDDLSLKIHK